MEPGVGNSAPCWPAARQQELIQPPPHTHTVIRLSHTPTKDARPAFGLRRRIRTLMGSVTVCSQADAESFFPDRKKDILGPEGGQTQLGQSRKWANPDLIPTDSKWSTQASDPHLTARQQLSG